MSGMEMIALSAALGAGIGGISAANKGGNPLEGALIGGATGAAGGALGGLGGAASGATGAAGGTAAQAFPVAMDAALPAIALDGSTAALTSGAAANTATPFLVSDPLISQMAAMDLQMASSPIAQTAGISAPTAQNLAMKDIMTGVKAFGGSGQQQQGQASPAQMRRGQQVNITAPIASLLEEQNRVPVRRISLL